MTIDASSKCLVIVPARGGSKGIPRKNLFSIAGMPLIAWTIASVADATEPMRCVVSTDDDDIARVAHAHGAEAVPRPENLAGDESPTEPSLIHVVHELARTEGYEPVEIVLLQATSPVRLRGSLDSALHRFRESGATSLLGVVETQPFIWQGTWDAPKPLYDVDDRPRRQDLTEERRCYRETGSLYITSREALLKTGNRISGRTVLFPMKSGEGIDIDTVEDMKMAESMLERGADVARS